MAKTRTQPSAKCHYCEKTFRVRPAAGDWVNAILFPMHKNKSGKLCEGSCTSPPDKEIVWPPGF